MTTIATSEGAPTSSSERQLPKALTGIRGLDEITGGGLPKGRPTLVTGASGSGKTLFGIEFLVHGAIDFDEPGVLLTFEESAGDLAANVSSLGFDLEQMQADGLLAVDAFRIDPAEIIETGAFDLDGLFIRLALAVDSIGARRVVLDTIEVLFGAFDSEVTIRAELGRLFRWMKERGLTAIVTGEQGERSLTRHGIEEYVSDCVIVLDHRVHEELSTRRLRVLKYRGSFHGTNEYPFLITDRGLVVLPITSMGLAYGASDDRISSGTERLDHMLGGGLYRGTTALISGEAGTGKTTIAAQMLATACARGERALFVSFEESPAQLVRNMASVGIDLARWIDAGLLHIWAGRPTAYGLEMHLAILMDLVEDFGPTVVALDAMTALGHVGEPGQVTSAVTREIDLLKARGITTVVTSLTQGGPDSESSAIDITSLIDTWILLRNLETNGERNRLLFVRKSRGSAHSNQVREFVLTDRGIDLVDVYVGAHGVLAGSARLAQQAEERAAAVRRHDDVEQRKRALARRTAEVEAQIATLRAELADDVAVVGRLAEEHDRLEAEVDAQAAEMAGHRWADPAASDQSTEGDR
jgi:circadian clock protein KaiC